ncbi:hypothetical protein IFR05_003409 [Cadophora sp. M221]|nr:hypothetical protein IFR05_003409 [Cadophora sp. M221]
MAGRGGNTGGRGGNGGGRGKGRGGGGGGGAGGGREGAGAKTCNTCHKVGHIAADCRSAGKTFECTNCNMNNHTTADCTKGAKNGEKKGDKRGEKKGDNNPAPGKGKASRPCRFCQEMHLDKECPTKGVKGSSSTYNGGDARMRDVFGAPEFSPPCQYCGGQHFSNDCPKIPHQQADQYQFQRYPAQTAPLSNFWDVCDDVHEEFTSSGPFVAATKYGPVDVNEFPTFYTQPIVAGLYLQQQHRRDIEGDIIMDWY